MKVTLEIPEYNHCLRCNWEGDFEIEFKIDTGYALITANKDGLISLANHCLNLAQDAVPAGCHMHLDAYNSLEPGSDELIIQKK